jgi:hypothetical protein
VTPPFPLLLSIRFPQAEMAQTAKVLYNLESLPHFDSSYEYGFLKVLIFNRIKKSAEGLQKHARVRTARAE